jgi:FkbH-like protein
MAVAGLEATTYPFNLRVLLRRRAQIKQELAERSIRPLRVACLGGSSTQELVDFLELFLLKLGFRPELFESDFNRYLEEALFPGPELQSFAPEVVVVHNGLHNLQHLPTASDQGTTVADKQMRSLDSLLAAVDSLHRHFGCCVVLNNLPYPDYRVLGNLDGTDPRGLCHFILGLNLALAANRTGREFLQVHDVHYLSAQLGLDHYFDPARWHLYRIAESSLGTVHLAHSLSRVIGSQFGASKKCLVVDLDNTLWGGVIGDDGADGIELGPETASGDAFQEFQRYLQQLKQRGVLLAVASKNDPDKALQGLGHPHSQLGPQDFAAFEASWDPKDQSLHKIAKELGLGLDSFVFLDDNPFERELVRAQCPVSVPEVIEVGDFRRVIDRERYFEPGSVTAEDLKRSAHYQAERGRAEASSRFASYDDYLRSLEMEALVESFSPGDLERIAQLVNKTNQFNLTTRRLSLPQLQELCQRGWLNLSARLRDKHQDYGLVSVVLGEYRGTQLHLALWLMSCRVLRRGLENAIFEKVVEVARERGTSEIWGYYLPTEKNQMVADFYPQLGFCPAEGRPDAPVQGQAFRLELGLYRPTQHCIRRVYSSERCPGNGSGDPARHTEPTYS